jgi:DNA invertase Pin-like site-specific DNA recombinase
MKIGYARVSSNSQELELQKQALLKAGCKEIFSESISGKDNNRTELINMLKPLRPDDVIVVYKIDRIARSLKGLICLLTRNPRIFLVGQCNLAFLHFTLLRR